MKPHTIPAISIILKPSFLLLGLYVGIAMLSGVAVWLVAISMLLKAMLLTLIIIATIYIVMRDVLLCLPWSWRQVVLSSQGKLTLLNQRQEEFSPRLKANSIHHPLLTVLNFKRSSLRFGWQTALILTPSLVHDADQFRRLRVWLKWSPYGAVLEADLAALAD
ncbi:MAG TPA: hypothetical protein VGD04_04705 [Methylophilus sp.]